MKKITTILFILLNSQLYTDAQYTPGIQRNYFEGSYNKLADFTAAKPLKIDTVSTVSATVVKLENYALNFKGYIKIDTEGNYTFFTSSDDGSALYIDSMVVVWNDGLHSLQERSGVKYLTSGYHLIEISYFNKTGGSGLTASYSLNGVKQKIPDAALYLKNQVAKVADDSRVVFLENLTKELNAKIDKLILAQAAQDLQRNTIITQIANVGQAVNAVMFENQSANQLLNERITKIEALPRPEKIFLKYPLARIKDTIIIIK
jgi:hypothetical protein